MLTYHLILLSKPCQPPKEDKRQKAKDKRPKTKGQRQKAKDKRPKTKGQRQKDFERFECLYVVVKERYWDIDIPLNPSGPFPLERGIQSYDKKMLINTPNIPAKIEPEFVNSQYIKMPKIYSSWRID